MTRRHDSLIALTHDHHHALAELRRLRRAANGDVRERLRQATQFLESFDSRSTHHFRQEEEFIFPLLVDEPESETLLSRLLMEHVRIHALVAALRSEVQRGTPSAALIERLVSLFVHHIRLEEKELFPAIQRIVPGVVLDSVVVSRVDGSFAARDSGLGVDKTSTGQHADLRAAPSLE